VLINGRTVEEYCGQHEFSHLAFRAVHLVEMEGMLDVRVRVEGGGLMGQAGAISLGIARALNAMQPEMRQALKKDGLLSRDPRMRERKKSGQPGARKRFQFSKR
jgi:small subunit ribosomal protein S9